MIVVDKVTYWLDIADDDIKAIKSLIKGRNYLHAGFFCHLVAEKALKAVIASIAEDPPPKIHDLIKLSKRAEIYVELSEEQRSLLDELIPLQIEARYPEYKRKISQKLTKEKIETLYRETEEFLCWIKKRLEK